MIESIQSLVENENAIGFITAAFFFYATILWLLVPIWVYIDSKKKYNNPMLSMFLFAIILPLNIPGILFYIIIRPEDHLDVNLDRSDDNHSNLNIPIVNFVNDKQDITMSLELKINGGIVSDKFKHDLNLDINLNSNSENLEIKHKDVEVEENESYVDSELEKESIFANLGASVSTFFASLKRKKSEDDSEDEDVVSTEIDTIDTDISIEESDKSELEVGVNLNSSKEDSSKSANSSAKNNSKSSKKKKNKKKSKK